MDANLVSEFRLMVARGVADGSIKMPEPSTVQVSFRSKYRAQRSPEDEFSFQKRAVFTAKKQLANLLEAKAKSTKINHCKIRLGMAQNRLRKARLAIGMHQ